MPQMKADSKVRMPAIPKKSVIVSDQGQKRAIRRSSRRFAASCAFKFFTNVSGVPSPSLANARARRMLAREELTILTISNATKIVSEMASRRAAVNAMGLVKYGSVSEQRPKKQQ